MNVSIEAGKRVVGTKQVKRALLNDKAEKVYIAKDADIRVTKEIIELCNQKGIEIIYVDSMKKLGQQCNIDVNAASAALLK
ncbi:MAG TPA: 50S ribosomal protein L7ae-like protein [Tissierellia bacterium]|nr:50S ribosomal protein L7ae-like protein [Tissierellia bacterium]